MSIIQYVYASQAETMRKLPTTNAITEAPKPHNKDGVMVESYRGKVIAIREENGYDDSDWIATVWSEEKNAPIEICYATTRGWTYLNGAVIDATEEIRAKYNEWKRRETVSMRWNYRNNTKDFRHALGLTYAQFKRLERVYPRHTDAFEVCRTLLTTKRFRSEFRQAMMHKLKDWLNDSEPKYPAPFTAKMLHYLHR